MQFNNILSFVEILSIISSFNLHERKCSDLQIAMSHKGLFWQALGGVGVFVGRHSFLQQMYKILFHNLAFQM